MRRRGNCTMIWCMRMALVVALAVGAVALGACGAQFTAREESDTATTAPAPAMAFVEKEMAAAGAPQAVPMPAAPARALPPLPAPAAMPAPVAVAAPPRGDSVARERPSPIDRDVAALVRQQRIIVRTVDSRLVVTDIQASLDSIEAMAQELSGWKVSSNVSQKHRATISIRVPADQLDGAVLRLRDLAVEVEAEVSTSKDVTDEYVDSRSRLENLRSTEKALLRLMERAEKVEEALNVQKSLTEVQGDIESLQGRVKFLEETSAFSLINVTLELEPAEMGVDGGVDQTTGVGEVVRFRAFFKPPEGMEEYFFTWDFGDGSRLVRSDRTAPTEEEDTRVTATVNHAYGDERDSPYIAEVKITGTGDSGVAEGEDTVIVTVSKRPSIEVFAGQSIRVEEGQEVEFAGSFTRPRGLTDVKFRWNFGDGTAGAEGLLEAGATNAVATHTYEDHRPFPFRAILTITAQSEVGEVEASNSLGVEVAEARGWVVGGWSFGDQGKTAVRALSLAGQVIGSVAIWLVIFSPLWAVIGFVGWAGRRRFKGRKKRPGGEGSRSTLENGDENASE